MIELPLQQVPHFSFRIVLDGVAYRLYFDWNTRESFWYLTIRDTDENILASNLKILPWILLTRQHPQIALPDGDFFVTDESSDFPKTKGEITVENFGIQFKLYYVTESEIAEIMD